jgi:hypothetical protein
VGDAVDVGRAEGERLAGLGDALGRLAADDQALLPHGAGGNADRARGEVVVVEAGVVVVHPADQPDGDVLVTVQLDVGAGVGAVGDEVLPRLGAGGDIGDEGGELVLVEVVRGWVDHADRVLYHFVY